MTRSSRGKTARCCQPGLFGLEYRRRSEASGRSVSRANGKHPQDQVSGTFTEASLLEFRANARQLILLGANDAVLDGAPTNQHCPIDQYKENLGKIISHPSIKAHAPKILLVTPPPLDEIKHGDLTKKDGLEDPLREHAVSAAYSEKAREVARENPGVVLIDLWQALMDKAIELTPADYQSGGPWLGSLKNGKSGGLDTLLPDGLHMGGDGYRVFFEAVRPHIGTEWAGLSADSDFVYPTWRQLHLP